MPWAVLFHPDFLGEAEAFPAAAYDELLVTVRLLQQFGPHLKRPHCDTLKGSKHANMKELRFLAADGVWRVAFAFDPDRRAVLLVGGDKAGSSEKKFYKALIRTADGRFDSWLED